MKKYEKVWKSMKKCEKVWKSMKKYEQIWKSMKKDKKLSFWPQIFFSPRSLQYTPMKNSFVEFVQLLKGKFKLPGKAGFPS